MQSESCWDTSLLKAFSLSSWAIWFLLKPTPLRMLLTKLKELILLIRRVSMILLRPMEQEKPMEKTKPTRLRPTEQNRLKEKRKATKPKPTELKKLKAMKRTELPRKETTRKRAKATKTKMRVKRKKKFPNSHTWFT